MVKEKEFPHTNFSEQVFKRIERNSQETKLTNTNQGHERLNCETVVRVTSRAPDQAIDLDEQLETLYTSATCEVHEKFHNVVSEQQKQKFKPANVRIALARPLIDGYSSRKRKVCPDSFQAKKCVLVVPDDVRLASVRNHMSEMVPTTENRSEMDKK
ncbi:hypothetical protein TNCV_638621 [Trichonephila clavipes]|nr:hypothetical protein TNCV_638621 [Trichonephila clavipes]